MVCDREDGRKSKEEVIREVYKDKTMALGGQASDIGIRYAMSLRNKGKNAKPAQHSSVDPTN